MSLSGAIDAPSRELEPTLSAFRVEWRPLAELAAVGADWRALAARVLAPNVFYEPGFALAAAPVFGRGVGAGLVWSQAMPPRLLGLFPARVERFRHGMPVLVGWTHPYAPLGAPLVDRELSEPVIAAWFAHVAGAPRRTQRRLRATPARPSPPERRSRPLFRRGDWGKEAQGAAPAAQAARREGCRHVGQRTRRPGARAVFRARSGRLEGPRRDRGARECRDCRIRHGGAHRARRRRQGEDLAAARRCPPDRCLGHAQKRRERVVLEDRLRRELRALLARRAAPPRRDAHAAR